MTDDKRQSTAVHARIVYYYRVRKQPAQLGEALSLFADNKHMFQHSTGFIIISKEIHTTNPVAGN